MIIQCDFDGTVTTNNVSLLLRERFAIGNWQRIEADYLQGRLGVDESNKRQFALIREPKEKLVAFASKNAKVRAGFSDFAYYCRSSGIRLIIVSSGLDFYIEAVLNKIGARDIELYCARTSFGQDGIAVSYIGPDGSLLKQGFKEKYLTWLKKRGGRVTYIGDGLSDLAAASAADQVFATGHLHRLLGAKQVSHYSFTDFHDILHQLCAQP